MSIYNQLKNIIRNNYTNYTNCRANAIALKIYIRYGFHEDDLLKEIHSTDIYATAPPSLKTHDQLSLVSHSRWTYIYRRTKEEEEIEELIRKGRIHAVTCCDFHQDWTT